MAAITIELLVHNGNASHNDDHPLIKIFFLCLFAFSTMTMTATTHTPTTVAPHNGLPLYGAIPDANRHSHLSGGVIYLYSFINSEKQRQ